MTANLNKIHGASVLMHDKTVDVEAFEARIGYDGSDKNFAVIYTASEVFEDGAKYWVVSYIKSNPAWSLRTIGITPTLGFIEKWAA